MYCALSDTTTISHFTRRKKIHINSSIDGALTDFQIKLNITYISAMQIDFNDIRFSELNGNYIYHWLEIKTDSVTATIWIKTDVPVTDGKDIYMYYGNTNLSANNDIDNTFLLGDDFQGSSIDTNKWDTQSSYPTVSNGCASFVDKKSIKNSIAFDFAQPAITMYCVDINVMPSSNQSTMYMATYDRNLVVGAGGGIWYQEGSYDRYMPGVSYDWWNGTNRGARLGVTRHEFTTIQPSNTRWVCTGVGQDFDDTRYELNNYPDCSTRHITILTGYTVCDVDVYWTAVRKYTLNEPTISIGTEQHKRRTPQIIM